MYTDTGAPWSRVWSLYQVPVGGQRTLRFATDVEDHYFDRVGEPGELQIGLLGVERNRQAGGDGGVPDRLETVLNVVKSSPHDGIIRISFNPTESMQVGDVIKLKAELSDAGENFEQVFLIRVSDPQPKAEREKKPEAPDNQLGLPRLVLVYKNAGRGDASWDQLEAEGIEMTHAVVMHPLVEGETLSAVYVNMESSVLLTYKGTLGSEEALDAADKRFISTVYFHTLFLYTITRSRKYAIVRHEGGRDQEVDLNDYLKDLFQSYYSEFLLNFEMQELIAALEA